MIKIFQGTVEVQVGEQFGTTLNALEAFISHWRTFSVIGTREKEENVLLSQQNSLERSLGELWNSWNSCKNVES